MSALLVARRGRNYFHGIFNYIVFFWSSSRFRIENEISVISYYQQWLFMPLNNINIHYRWFKKKAKMDVISESENRRNAFYVGAEQFLQMKLLDLCVNAGMSSIARHSPLGVFHYYYYHYYLFVLRYDLVPGGYYMHSGLLPAAMAIIYNLLLLILSYSLFFLWP